MAVSYKVLKKHEPVEVEGAAVGALATALNALFPGISAAKTATFLVWRDDASHNNPLGSKIKARAVELVGISQAELEAAVAAGEAPAIVAITDE